MTSILPYLRKLLRGQHKTRDQADARIDALAARLDAILAAIRGLR